MPRTLPLLLALCLLATAAARGAPYRLETVASGLHHPWSLAQLPDHSFLVTERRGRLLHVGPDGERQALTGVPETYEAGQGGFFDVMLHPGFDDNRLVYLSYAAGGLGANATAIFRGRLTATGLADGEEILRVQPLKDTPQHYGGRLAFLPDGSLLLTTGEGFDHREAAQNPASELGKVLRISDDGSVPADNPLVAAGAQRVWTLGHRNPQGMVVDADRGVVWLHEHGPRGGDEVNRLLPGENYGWPAVTHGIDYSGATISPYKHWPGLTDPAHVWVPSIAPSGLALYQGDRFPTWRGDLFLGALVDREVRRLDLEDGIIVGEERLFGELGERIRDVRSAPDGFLYLLTDSEAGRLVRVRPAQGTDH
ncbi:PQQ-dependent sugar dehydrogenase [Pseudohaliea rubra]|uniref:PQQ-dependent oxidoreductase, gdhB family n=1 Tax=Pseudohaliea rubra DSM 19751 TaxID=1265313 RepID=A0A095VQ85_9GAMM|nr:PQQ-dependent sugar dehydrogenase [Pseudohaliea rubra]KGE03288.1 PQQ-dependent oxidoreductase, gdhB family [Pseudohaliea rubra DSM 19751]